MGIPLDATKDEATPPTEDAGESNWDNMENEAPDNTAPEAIADPAKESETVAEADSEIPGPQPGPTPADAVIKAREKIRSLREREERAIRTLNGIRLGIDNTCLEVGRAVVEAPDFYPVPEAPEAPEAPKVTITAKWKNAPLELLNLWDSTMRILQKQHEIMTVGHLVTYLETNGSMIGLEGMTERRDEHIRKQVADFVEAQK